MGEEQREDRERGERDKKFEEKEGLKAPLF